MANHPLTRPFNEIHAAMKEIEEYVEELQDPVAYSQWWALDTCLLHMKRLRDHLNVPYNDEREDDDHG